VSRVLGLTGASGYIGQAVMRGACAAGWQVVAIGRHPVEGAQSWRLADLGTSPPDGLVDGLDALLHLAANTGGENLLPTSELTFARDLAMQASIAGIPFVFASSQAAADNAPSEYGRTKFAIEQLITPLGAVAIRPGLVIGGREAGLFGLLVSLVRASPLLPELLPRPVVQPIHVDDLSAALLAACRRPDLAGGVLAAAGDPVDFNRLLALIARHRLRVRRLHVPVPLTLLRGVLALAAPILGSRLSPARLNSLIQLPPLDARADLAALGIVLRPLTSALDRRGRGTRRLLMEGHALARAMICVAPPPALLRRYARLLHMLGPYDALPLPPSLLGKPTWLASLDTSAGRQQAASPGRLAWRMNIILRLAEASPTLTELFLMMPNRSGRVAALLDFVRAGTRELHIRLVAPLARRLAKGI
jgi:nucleoside-diphosphate-sugar epimerase